MKFLIFASTMVIIATQLTGCQTSGLASRRVRSSDRPAEQPARATQAAVRVEGAEDHVVEVVDRPGLQQQVQPAGARSPNFARFGWDDLFVATRRGKADEVERLIQEGADIEARDIHDRTPIHIAALFGKTDVLRVLIDNDADVNSRDQWRVSPLQRAVLAEETRGWDRTEIRDILRENGGVKKGLWTDVNLEREQTQDRAPIK